MIPAEAALILWLVVSIALFALINPLRAFLLTYVIGYLVLPCEVGTPQGYMGSIVISQALRIDKMTVCNIGALLGTALFASHVFRRFRFHWLDLAFGAVVVGIFVTSMVNGLGPKDGLSHGFEEIREYLPLIILSRMYLQNTADLHEAMRVILGGAFLYSFVCVVEWRFSPMLHRLVYGYFQHSFDQFARYSHFRPVGFLRHAIELSFFMGTSAVAAAWLWYRGMLKPLWGFVPAWAVFGAITVGLLSTMTFSGYGAFVASGIALLIIAFWRTRLALALLPLIAIIWMVGRYTNQIDASLLMRAANSIDSSRSASLEYRLQSEKAHLAAASQSFFFGRGAMNGTLVDTGWTDEYGESGPVNGMAVDAWWLITIVFYGIVGIAAWYFVWIAGIIDTLRKWRGMSRELRTLAALVAVMLGAQCIDFLFNSFPSPFLLMLNMGLVSVLQCHSLAIVRQPVAVWIELPADPAESAATGGAG